MCLAQRKAPGRNEAAGALEVLGLLDLEGCIVTADALHCHRDFASTVLERGADYVLALKENQSKLFAAAARRYARSGARSVAERREPATHDRCEWRRATVLRDTTFAAVQKFPGVVALARITSRRRVLGACAEPPQVRYFLAGEGWGGGEHDESEAAPTPPSPHAGEGTLEPIGLRDARYCRRAPGMNSARIASLCSPSAGTAP